VNNLVGRIAAIAVAIGLDCLQAAEGATVVVSFGGHLQAALDAAQPGDQILLEAGAAFIPFVLPGVHQIRAVDVSEPEPSRRINDTAIKAVHVNELRSTVSGVEYRSMAIRPILLLLLVAVAGCAAKQSAVSTGSPSSGPERSRIIVQLRLPMVESEQQRIAQIPAVRDALIRELAVGSFRVVRLYETIPFVALEVSPAAFAVVKGSAHVIGTEPDTAVAPR
jgi:hypothetical protein